jgi:hypothetical protein
MTRKGKEYVTFIELDDLEEVHHAIKEYVKSVGGSDKYWRTLIDTDHVWIDYGSYANYVYVYFSDSNARKEYLDSIGFKEE